MFPGMRVLLTTGYNEDLAAGLERSADVLGKPYGETELADRVRAALDRPGRDHPPPARKSDTRGDRSPTGCGRRAQRRSGAAPPIRVRRAASNSAAGLAAAPAAVR